MSAGAYIDSIYENDLGNGFAIRVQPETVTVWNPAGAAALVPGNPSAQVSSGGRSIGVNARLARFSWVGVAPTGYSQDGVITVPILTKAAYDALVKNTPYPYLGGQLNLVGKTAETIR